MGYMQLVLYPAQHSSVSRSPAGTHCQLPGTRPAWRLTEDRHVPAWGPLCTLACPAGLGLPACHRACVMVAVGLFLASQELPGAY